MRLQTVGRDGPSRSRFRLRVAGVWFWCAGFDVVLEKHVVGKSVRACERLVITLYEKAQVVGTGQRYKWMVGVGKLQCIPGNLQVKGFSPVWDRR